MAKDIATKNLGTVHEKRRVNRVEITIARDATTGVETMRARFGFEKFTIGDTPEEVTSRSYAGECVVPGAEIEQIKDFPAVWLAMQAKADAKLDGEIP